MDSKAGFSSFVLGVLCLTMWFLLAGCYPSTEILVSPTETILPLELASTPVPIIATLTPTDVLEETITPTTEIPVLATAEAIAFTENLLRNNNGCRLPCWWGFKPGQTSWEEAYQYIKPFADGYKKVESAEYLAYNIRRPFITESFRIPVSEEIASYYPSQAFLLDDKYIIQIIDADPGYTPNYNFSEILSDYGKPDDVFIRTMKNKDSGDLPFQIFLYYPTQGIIAGYQIHGEVVGSTVEGCPMWATRPRLVLWSTSTNYSFLDLMKIMGFYDETWEFLSLDKSTKMDVDAFFKTYQEAGAEKCLQTPRSLWPHYGPP